MSGIFQEIKRPCCNNKGMALVTVLVVSTVLALVGNSFLSGSASENVRVNNASVDKQVFYIAESGLVYIRRQLTKPANWKNWSQASVNGPVVDGGTSSFAVDVTYDAVTEVATATATGIFNGKQQQLVEELTYVPDSVFKSAACGCAGTNLGSGTVDSYDGAVGLYDGGVTVPITNEGSIGSNGIVDLGQTDVLGNVEVGGNLIGQSNSSVSGTARLGGNATAMSGTVTGGITENILPAPQPCDCGAIDVVTEVAEGASTNNNSDLNFSGDFHGSWAFNEELTITKGTVTLNTGTYYFSKLNISGQGKIEVNASTGPVIVFLGGNTGPFDIGGGGTINITGTNPSAGDLRIYSDTTAEIKLHGNAGFAGVLFAPFATVTASGTVDNSGSIIAGTVNVNGNVGLHYDTNLPNISEPLPTNLGLTVTATNWRKNDPPAGGIYQGAGTLYSAGPE